MANKVKEVNNERDNKLGNKEQIKVECKNYDEAGNSVVSEVGNEIDYKIDNRAIHIKKVIIDYLHILPSRRASQASAQHRDLL